MVSLSASKDSSTATRAPPGHVLGWSERPARTALTTFITLSMLHFQPGVTAACGVTWADISVGTSSVSPMTCARMRIPHRECRELRRKLWSGQDARKVCHWLRAGLARGWTGCHDRCPRKVEDRMRLNRLTLAVAALCAVPLVTARVAGAQQQAGTAAPMELTTTSEVARSEYRKAFTDFLNT